MNAIEFVKMFGVDGAIAKVSELKILKDLGDQPKGQEVELINIVKAFDCVMEHGSVERAKKYAESDYTAPEVKEFLLKYINLVEQCKND